MTSKIDSTSYVPDQAPSKPDSSSVNVVNALAVFRVGLGIGSIIAPITLCQLFGIPLGPEGAFIMRLAGARDVVLGAMVWTAKKDGATQLEKSELRRALWAGLIIDCVDCGSTLLATFEGNLLPKDAAAFLAGAIAFVGMAWYGLS